MLVARTGRIPERQGCRSHGVADPMITLTTQPKGVTMNVSTMYAVRVAGQVVSRTSNWHVARENLSVVFHMIAASSDMPTSAPAALAELVRTMSPGESFSLETLRDGKSIIFELSAETVRKPAEVPVWDLIASA
jgi:hypothetical protein